MSIALLTRTAVVVLYLAALLLNGRADLLTGLVAAAIVAIWVIRLLLDRRTQGGPAPALRPR